MIAGWGPTHNPSLISHRHVLPVQCCTGTVHAAQRSCACERRTAPRPGPPGRAATRYSRVQSRDGSVRCGRATLGLAAAARPAAPANGHAGCPTGDTARPASPRPDCPAHPGWHPSSRPRPSRSGWLSAMQHLACAARSLGGWHTLRSTSLFVLDEYRTPRGLAV